MLYFDQRHDLAATVLAEGLLRTANGSKGSIHTVGAQVGGVVACNRWVHWYYQDEHDQLVAIDQLRERLCQQLHAIG